MGAPGKVQYALRLKFPCRPPLASALSRCLGPVPVSCSPTGLGRLGHEGYLNSLPVAVSEASPPEPLYNANVCFATLMGAVGFYLSPSVIAATTRVCVFGTMLLAMTTTVCSQWFLEIQRLLCRKPGPGHRRNRKSLMLPRLSAKEPCFLLRSRAQPGSAFLFLQLQSYHKLNRLSST